MRKVFKSNFETNINRFLFLFNKLIVCQLQSFLSKPPLGRGAERFTKIAFKSRQAPARQVTEFLQR